MNSKNNTEKKELLKRGGKMSDGSKEKQNYKVPLWNKLNLSIEEASIYSNIGTGKL